MKELSITEKARRYDEVIAMAKECIIYVPDKAVNKYMLNMFPELKESEDEKMRKSIIYALRNGGFYNNDKTDEAIAWLEKQGEQKSINDLTQQEAIDIADTKFKFGDWIVYNRNDHSRKIMQIYDIRDNRYYFNDSIHFSWSVKECDEKSHLWTIEDAKDGDVLVTDSGRPFIFKGCLDKKYPNNPVAYCGICSNGDFGIGLGINRWTDENVYPATKEQCDILFRKMKEAGYEWNAEKKVLKKIKLKFNIGDWIVTADGKVNQVISVDEDGDGYTLDDDTYFSGSWCDKYHLWTIDDAREGDVLKEDSCIFIIEKMNPNGTAIVHCCLFDDGEFDLTGSTLGFDVDSTCPATKEQRDFLFQKMKEAGYEWDKKELKKIEDVPENYK